MNPIGLGCMGMSFAYGRQMAEEDAVALLHAAVERGVDHFDTAEMYGAGHNEELLGKAFHDRREDVFIATKFGPVLDPETGMPSGVDGSEDNARRALEESLRHLQTDYVDLWYLHRRDPSRPIEETVGAMSRLVEEGKVRSIGLSEVSPDTLRRAAEVHPIAAVQSEYSIFTRFAEDDVLPACEELGTAFVAYAPLGRGMLAGAFDSEWEPEGWDFRHEMVPRFQGDALDSNLHLVEEVRAVAKAADATPAQVAVAYVLSKSESILTIPGTTRLEHLKRNLTAADLTLTHDHIERLDTLADAVKGERYDEGGMATVDG